ncbi:ATP-dependent DNA helicase RecG [Vibrio variabilis]|uniref:ATP-dependent DNA helicase RecG n=1 Tax=Vibrio variabilis TaxID=990271 RepID=A0ABQ0J5Z1_9VIBR|nr:ATP-dependent DNA helicase RecG [Vibrio variabilis]
MDGAAVDELLPSGLYNQQMTLTEALHIIHRPPPNINLDDFDEGKHPAQQRLIIEELMAQNLSMLAVRSKGQQDAAIALQPVETLKQKLLGQLPFSPTALRLASFKR